MKRQIRKFWFVKFEEQELATQARKIKRLLKEGFEPYFSNEVEKELYKKINL